MAEKEIYLSVVIPAYNEEDRISPTLRRVVDYVGAQPYDAEILVVVDGSRDATIEKVRTISVEHPNVKLLDNGVNRGKGFSVRRGMLESRGRFILFSDADLSTPIEEVEQLLTPLQNGYDVAIASRGLPHADIRVRQPLWRQTMGRTFNWFVQRLALPGIWDSQCGFKCFPREVARRIFPRQRVERFGFDVEVLWIARKFGYQIAEVPVTWINHPLSKVHPVRDATWMLIDLLRLRLNDWRGVYGDTTEPASQDANATGTPGNTRDSDGERSWRTPTRTV